MDFKNQLASLNNLKDTVKRLENEINSLKNARAGRSNDSGNLSGDDNVVNIIDELQDRQARESNVIIFNLSESNVIIFNLSESNVVNIIDELQDRQARESNVIIFNLSESNHPNHLDRKKEETEKVTQILNSIDNTVNVTNLQLTRLEILNSIDNTVNVTNLQLTRLGKFTHEKKRPIKQIHDIEKLTDRYPDAKLCLVGDFNLPGIEWSREDDQLIGIPSNSLERFVCDNLAYHGLLQHNFNVNMNNTTLDLVLVNSDNVKVYEEPYHLVSPDGHHPPISFNLSIVIDIEPFALRLRKQLAMTIKNLYPFHNNHCVKISIPSGTLLKSKKMTVAYPQDLLTIMLH
ncbi:Endonuclease-reverse transcriptase [Popillia japonica]|uniref:Endonuclease-reverse transcriptase n=1 Tax=Popillia japonica TaxID=7064 RepID=A0AAW1N314_POPJA